MFVLPYTADFPVSHPARDSDCLACHMPRRDAKDGGHTAFTDHRIQRRPESQPPLPSNTGIVAWREPSQDFQKRNLGVAYIDVGMQRHSPPFIVQGYRTLTEVQQQFSDDSEFFKWIGEALLLARKPAEAQIAFDRALELNPQSALNEAKCGRTVHPTGKAGDQAIAHLERAVVIDPLNLAAVSTLIDLYQQQGKTEQAAQLSAKTKAAFTQTSEAEDSPTDSPRVSAKKSEDLFKNISILKGVSPDQLISAMKFISSSLGVECSYCHVENHFEKDDKKPKQRAREMMRMVSAINKNSFDGSREVTCYSCHHGAHIPPASPTVDDSSQPSASKTKPEAQTLPANLPTTTQLIDNYIHALGGAATIESITSRVERGTANFEGRTTSVELFTQAPQKQLFVRHLPQGDSVTNLNGQAGWIAQPGHAARKMHSEEIEIAKIDADLSFPAAYSADVSRITRRVSGKGRRSGSLRTYWHSSEPVGQTLFRCPNWTACAHGSVRGIPTRPESTTN